MSLAVTTIPIALQPDRGREEIIVPEGLTIAEIVGLALPGIAGAPLDRIRVALVLGDGMEIVPRRMWRLARPHAGVRIVIRIMPGKDGLKSILSILVAVAATAITGFFAPAIASAFGTGALGSFVKGALTLGLTALGGLLINAILPPQAQEKSEKPTFAITGWKNQFVPDGPVPVPFGFHRYAPPFAAMSYLEVVGDLLYVRAVFEWGYAPVEISQLKLGETLLSKFDEVEVETRLGLPDDEPLTLYTQQVIEESIGAELQRVSERNDAGDVINETGPLTPISRFTATDTAYAIVILSFPAGLLEIDRKGKEKSQKVVFNRRYRAVGTEPWTSLANLSINGETKVGMYRSDRIDFPTRGQYEVEYTRETRSEDEGDSQHAYTSVWVVLQSFRPEYPFNFSKKVARTALRIKSTSQLNGTLDTFNGMVKRVALDWDADDEVWVARATQSPASAALFALRGPALYRPVPDEEIDLPAFADWHEFCAAKGLKYNRIHDFEGSFGETLAAIGAAGRAVVRHNGRKWTVVIDRPRDTPVDHVNPRNASGITVSPSYFEPPHALRVPFIDETNGFQAAERVVPWPGHVGSIDITEELKLPGNTDPAGIWREARRRQYEIMHRSVRYTATQAGTARTATTGDLVMASRDILRRAMHSARVKTVRGDLVEIDDIFTMEEGENYAVRFRVFDEEDTIGESVVRTIATAAGETQVLRLTGDGLKPATGDLIHFGPAAQDSWPLIIAGIERGRNGTSILSMLPAAEIIDTLTDAEEPPAWNGRVGSEIDALPTAPATPRIVGIDTGTTGTGDANGLTIRLTVGLGSAVSVASFAVQHRLAGETDWETPMTCSVSEASVDIDGYTFGDEVELQAWAVAYDGTPSVATAIVTVTIGSEDFMPPLGPEAYFLAIF